MCTSFISRNQDIIIGMNFDNNGMKYNINTSNPHQFTVLVDGGRGKYPSFGVNSNGLFINNLLVDSNGRGLYRRPSTKVTHTTKLITDVLSGIIKPENLDEYLKHIEVVNTPNWSTHNMICDSKANVWVIEPGRGHIVNLADSSPFFIMTNFSLWDCMYNDITCECNRYKIVKDELSKNSKLTIDDAFHILDLAKQTSCEWTTALSMVYSHDRHTVYYCINRNFEERHEYTFPI